MDLSLGCPLANLKNKKNSAKLEQKVFQSPKKEDDSML